MDALIAEYWPHGHELTVSGDIGRVTFRSHPEGLRIGFCGGAGVLRQWLEAQKDRLAVQPLA